MSLKRIIKSSVLALILIIAGFTAPPFLVASLAEMPLAEDSPTEIALSEISLAELERLSASGTLEELEAALLETGANVVFPNGNNPLHIAAEHSADPAVINLLIEHGAPLSAEGLERLTPLMLAAAYNHEPSIIEALVAAGAEINAADGQGRTPLRLAAALNTPPIVEALLRHGAAPGERDRIGRTPVWMAANRSNARIVQLLLKAGASADEPNNDGVTPILIASNNPDAAVLSLLLEAGANPNARGVNRHTPLMNSIAAGASLESIQALIDGGANVNAENDQNRSAILILTSRRYASPEILSALIEAGANPNAMDSSLTTPLMEACKQNNTAMVETLLNAGARVDLRDRNSRTPILHAAANGAPLEIYELLKKAGADINGTTRQGASPLMVALESNTGTEAFEALLRAGANPNHQGLDTISILMSAIASQDINIVRLLLNYGADPNLPTWDGLTPMMLAAQRIRSNDMFEALVASGANLDNQSNQGITALMIAATSGNAVAIESLVELGADLEAADIEGLTALFHAVQASERGDGARSMTALIHAGSNLNVQDASGATPLMHAALRGLEYATRRLIGAGAGMDFTDLVGWTALHFAARGPSGADVTGVIVNEMALLEKSVDIPDNTGTTPLMVAAAHNNAETVRLLLEAGANFSIQDNTGRSAYEYSSLRNAHRARDVIREEIDRRANL